MQEITFLKSCSLSKAKEMALAKREIGHMDRPERADSVIPVVGNGNCVPIRLLLTCRYNACITRNSYKNVICNLNYLGNHYVPW